MARVGRVTREQEKARGATLGNGQERSEGKASDSRSGTTAGSEKTSRAYRGENSEGNLGVGGDSHRFKDDEGAKDAEGDGGKGHAEEQLRRGA